MTKQVTEQYDVVICGGGLAGLCAAVAAARMGAKTCLVQDRPVLGGNSSSEVRVTPHGAAAFHGYARETGILSELLIEERAANHEEIFENGWTNSVWDMTQYDLVQRTENLTLHLNTAIGGVAVTGRELRAVHCRVANAEVDLTLGAKVFIDCTGHGLVAAEAGCEWLPPRPMQMSCEIPFTSRPRTWAVPHHSNCRHGRSAIKMVGSFTIRDASPRRFVEATGGSKLAFRMTPSTMRKTFATS